MRGSSLSRTNEAQPVIVVFIIQEGVRTVDRAYTQPLRDVGPVAAEPVSGTYHDLAGWTGIAMDSPPCQVAGLANPRFPIYLDAYDVEAQRKAYDVFAQATHDNAEFANSLFMFEAYSTQGVGQVPDASTAFAYRGDRLLTAPLITYEPAGAERDKKAAALGQRLRSILHEASGRRDMHAYVNYAYGDETPQQWYGSAKWRQDKLRGLKAKYDPEGRFSFYAPLA